MRNTAIAATVYLKDYTPPAFLIPEVELDISLFEDDALVRAKLAVERNSEAAEPTAPLQLDVDELTVESVILNGIALTPDQYTLDERHLTIPKVPDTFELVTVCRIYPKQNTKLMGIYTSSTGFFSLCEAEGFRRITPFLDRPDVMARYMVTLHADRERYPVLLANGNLIAAGGGGQRTPLGHLARPVSEALLSVCGGGRSPRSADRYLRHPIRQKGRCCSFLWSPGSWIRALLRWKP